jgi:hypothetical protein
MSLIGTVANYGGRQPENFTNIKQFVIGVSGSTADWVYSRPQLQQQGRVFITPTNKTLSVYIGTNLQVNGNLTVNGSIFNPSDRILKEEIEPISNSKIENLFNLEPVEYKFKNDSSKRSRYGLIAQDVEKIYPELINNTEFGYKAVNYTELIPILLSKMKEMQKEIDELREQVENKFK